MRYRPVNCLDIDIEIEKIRYRSTNYVVANVAYFNRNWVKGEYLIHREKNVRIRNEAFKRWVRIG